MSDQHNPNPLRPSDDTLTLDYVALKPGIYSPRESLSEYKGKLIDLSSPQPIPLGVGNENSVVYIYPQGTIEIIGEVYAWNKRVKPGIYSTFEKIRFLSTEIEVLARNEKLYESRHASYNKTITVPNAYTTLRNEEAEEILSLNYVDFNDQIVTMQNDVIYPIPILNGELTIYPDGTFKTKNIVIDSKYFKLVDPYGYLGDHENYTTINTEYSDVRKDDINPKNIYKLISRNEDGSVTYGAIEENKALKRQRWMMLPEGIIPINDGKVTLSIDNTIKIEGLVVTGKGYPITATGFRYTDLYQKNHQQELIVNEDYIDKTRIFVPVIKNLIDTQNQQRTAHVTLNDNTTYCYHPDNDSIKVNSDENDEIISVTFKAMKGWDGFKPLTEYDYSIDFQSLVERFGDIYLSPLNESEINKSNYPWVVKDSIMIGGIFRTPICRIDNKGKINKYQTIDHTLFYHVKDSHRSNEFITSIGYDTNLNLLGYPEGGLTGDGGEFMIIPEIIDGDKNTYLSDNFIMTSTAEDKINFINKLVPYHNHDYGITDNGVREGSFIITKENDKHYITVTGNVIWKNHDQYYTLEDGKVELDFTWPDIKRNEETGEYYSLFTEYGYFKDEPIFFKRKRNNTDNEEYNDFDNVDGIKRQEKGLFKLVRRNVTAYLTTYEKQLIDNYKYSHEYVHYDNKNVTIKIIDLMPINQIVESTRIENRIELDYHTFRLNEVIPNFFSVKGIYVKPTHNQDIKNILYFNRNQERIEYINAEIYFPIDHREHDYFLYKDKNILGGNTKGRIELTNDLDRHCITLPENSLNGGKYLDLAGYIDNGVTFGDEPYFTADEYHVLTDGYPTIHVKHHVDNILFFYRLSEDTKFITGSFYTSREGHYEIPVSLIGKYGFVDVWYDDPFQDKASVKRIKLRRDDTIEIIEIKDVDLITTKTKKISGTGEPRAKLKLYKYKDLNTVIGHSTVNNGGVWSISNFTEELVADELYRVVQEDQWGNVSYGHFLVSKDFIKDNDLLTALELTGVNKYLYPVNLRNTYQKTQSLNLVDSSIVFNSQLQQYEIKGIVMDEDGLIYEEGVYSIGQTPPKYRSNYITSGLPENTTPQIVNKKVNKYRVSKAPYLASSTLVIDTTLVDFNTLTALNEKWVIPRTFKEELKNILDSLTESEFTINYPNLSGIGLNNIKHVLYKFIDLVKINTDNCYIGRYQNKLVFEGLSIFRLDGSEFYLYQNGNKLENGNYYGYHSEGMNVTTFLSHLNQVKPWFYNNSNIVNKTNDTIPFYSLEEISLPNSIVNPSPRTVRIGVLKTSNNAFIDKSVNLEVSTPTHVKSPITIYNIGNWDTIKSFEDYNNELNIIYYNK